mmetsp:Transcript_4963/g.11646  ORF Transcript_4963/g.11646 Transcript_4963/m.11646 type:complete len:233 (+) Transcript_4963:636-1334(+)
MRIYRTSALGVGSVCDKSADRSAAFPFPAAAEPLRGLMSAFRFSDCVGWVDEHAGGEPPVLGMPSLETPKEHSELWFVGSSRQPFLQDLPDSTRAEMTLASSSGSRQGSSVTQSRVPAQLPSTDVLVSGTPRRRKERGKLGNGPADGSCPTESAAGSGPCMRRLPTAVGREAQRGSPRRRCGSWSALCCSTASSSPKRPPDSKNRSSDFVGAGAGAAVPATSCGELDSGNTG